MGLRHSRDKRQTDAALDANYIHGEATIGPLRRPVYFDLGGVFDLIDDTDYDRMANMVQRGDIPGASLITPTDLRYTERGVPIDVACTVGGSSSVYWVRRWMCITVKVDTKVGRQLTLTRLTIGFVPRTSPLLILGKRTCCLLYTSPSPRD